MASDKMEFRFTDAPITGVTVYKDQAEVTRLLRVKKALAGPRKILVSGIPTTSQIVSGSLRVECRGLANVKSAKLSYTEKSSFPKSALQEKQEQLREMIATMTKQITEQGEAAGKVLNESLVNLSLDALNKNVGTDGEGNSTVATPENFERLNGFVALHEKKSNAFDANLRKKHDALNSLTHAMSDNASSDAGVVVIGLDVTGDADLELIISYMVQSGSWNPKYEVHVSPADKTMTINYYALVQQNSGEDWVDVPVILSTVTAASYRNIQDLDVQRAVYAPVPKSYETPPKEYGYDQSPITAIFEIPGLTTVLADKPNKKVTIGVAQLKSQVHHKCIPKKCQQAYLEAVAANTGPYPILPGAATVFFGSKFVGKVNLEAADIEEELKCSLGVDRAVQIKYRPVRCVDERDDEASFTSVATYVHETEILNTHAEAIHVVVTDQVPHSKRQKLKVTMLEPSLTAKKPEKQGFKLKPKNVIDHAVDIGGKSSHKWTLKYQMEYPSNREIKVTSRPVSSRDPSDDEADSDEGYGLFD